MIKLDWKIYAVGIGILLLAVLIFLLEKILFFLIISSATIIVALILRFLHPVKYLGIELITLSTMLVGVVYGPVIGGIYGFVILLAHLLVGNYYMGNYLVWLVPEYILLGALSGIFGTEIIGALGVSFIIGMNVLNLILTLVGENERFAKELPFAVGNAAINSILLIHFFGSIVQFIG